MSYGLQSRSGFAATIPSSGTPGEGRVRVFALCTSGVKTLTHSLSRRTGRGRKCIAGLYGEQLRQQVVVRIRVPPVLHERLGVLPAGLPPALRRVAPHRLE